MYAVLILMLISTVLPASVANAAFLEDYAHTPTNYCAANPDGSIATDLVNTSK